MSTLDVREENASRVDKIVFSDAYCDGVVVAHRIIEESMDFDPDDRKAVRICDESAYVIIHSAEHAENLIKALRAAVNLGWLE